MTSIGTVEQIPLPQIMSATENFDEKNFIAAGGFGKVYKGHSEQYGTIAVKRLMDHANHGQGQHHFMMEIELLSAYNHENLVSLVGFCDQDREKILVYKYESNGSLDKHLQREDLNWIQRLQICLDAAKGLKYLHHDVGPQHRVVRRDVKSSNILLDENMKAKISDFGLSKVSPTNMSCSLLISSACGTMGYIDPEYLTYGVLTQKSDVYSFGVVLFEVLCGRLACVVQYKDRRQFLCVLAPNHLEKHTLHEIIYSNIRDQMDPNSLKTFSTIAYHCLTKCRKDRPTMSQIVEQLQKALDEQLAASSGLRPDAAFQQGFSSSMIQLGRQALRAFRRRRGGTSSKHSNKQKAYDPVLFQNQTTREDELTLADLALATDNFSEDNRIGAGSFGIVYKGKLLDGREVAIKRGETGQKTKKFQEKESAFDSELAFLSRLNHKNLVGFVGYCEEREENLFVYEYVKNGALYDHLHDKKNTEKSSSLLNSWKMRIKISLDAARGIEYLHDYAVPPIVHKDIKSSNILLDANWVAKVSDFGLSLMGPDSDSDHPLTQAAGTMGYVDLEYFRLNVLTAKSDVYSFGVVLLELLTGKKAIFKSDDGHPISLVDFSVLPIMSRELANILDKRVGPPEVKDQAEAVELMAYTAIYCVKVKGQDRPTMSDIVANLERALALCGDSHGSISSGEISIVSE